MKLKHGLRGHRLYQRWNNMMKRCYRPTNPFWDRYGGRGITVCERWHDVANFVADLDPTFEPNLELDRRDNNLGYSPENCRWVSRAVQAGNKEKVLRVNINGVTKTAAEWARENGIRRWIVWYRIKHLGWDPVDAVTIPKLSVHEVASRATAVASRQRSEAARSRKLS